MRIPFSTAHADADGLFNKHVDMLNALLIHAAPVCRMVADANVLIQFMDVDGIYTEVVDASRVWSTR